MVVDKKIKTPWYIGGLHFECRQCGDCCSGPDEGVIWISRLEIKLLAEHLDISESQLRKKYLKRIRFRVSILENPQTKDCIFLKNIGGTKKCTIYDVRPMQCRSWPFWPINLDSPDDWSTAAKKCSGLNKGKLYTFDEIEKIENQKRWWRKDTTSFICREVKQIYDWLDSNIKSSKNQCTACGKCCNFESFGHKLFVTTPELLYFHKNVKNFKSMPGQSCPYLKSGKCSVRDFRFAGCRIFFCKTDSDLQNKLSEQVMEKFKKLCEKFDFPYRYVDLATAMNSPELLELIEQ